MGRLAALHGVLDFSNSTKEYDPSLKMILKLDNSAWRLLIGFYITLGARSIGCDEQKLNSPPICPQCVCSDYVIVLTNSNRPIPNTNPSNPNPP